MRLNYNTLHGTSRFLHKLHVDSQSLPEVMELGRTSGNSHQEAKEKGSLPNRCTKQKRRRPEDKSRVTDPCDWWKLG